MRLMTSIFVIVGIPWSLTCAAMVMFTDLHGTKPCDDTDDTDNLTLKCLQRYAAAPDLSHRAVNQDKMKSLISGQ